MKRKLAIAGAALAALTTLLAVAQPAPVPAEKTLIPYEGVIHSNGAEATGSYDLRFSIYPDAAATGTPYWSELHESVPVVGGRFAVVLGEGTSPVGDLEEAWSGDGMHLGIELCPRLEGATPCALVPLTGRQRILAVPKATHATAAGALGHIIAVAPFAPPPDPRFWLLCDGRAIPATSRLGRYLIGQGNATPATPVLSDERFLMGAPGTGGVEDQGGHNDGHGHAFALQADNPPPGTPLHSHTHVYTRTNYASESIEVDTQSSRRLITGSSGVSTGGPSNVNHTHPISGTIGVAAADGDAAGANLPKFQKVHFYMKVN